MKSNFIRKTSLALACTLLISSISPSLICFAEETNNTAKEEVVYINLTASGDIKDIDVVNIFNLDQDTRIYDYGKYSSVRNMTTTDELKYKDGTTTANLRAGKVYYDGKLVEDTSPWNVSIKYFLDGIEYNAKDIIGKSGELKIHLTIAKNNEYNGPDFYKNYALNSTISFDTRKCTNIIADGATIANVGQSKQLSYISLPNRGLDEVITMKVEDFETDGLSVNGIPLNLNIKIDDSELMTKVHELQDGVTKIDNGANELNAGLETFGMAISEVENQLRASGLSQEQINTRITQLYAIKSQFARVNEIVTSSQELIESSAKIQQGIETLNNGIGTLESQLKASDMSKIANLQDQNQAAIDNLNAQIEALENQLEAAKMSGVEENEISQIEAQLNSLKNILSLITANKKANGNLTDNLTTISSAVSRLKNGSQMLNDSYSLFNEGLKSYTAAVIEFAKLAQNMQQYIDLLPKTDAEAKTVIAKLIAGYNQLSSGAIALVNGGSALADGTTQLRDATSNLDTQVTNKINDLVSNIKGEAQIGSFVSEKNTNVKAVQFVIKTEKIEKSEEQNSGENIELNENIFTRFIKLFKH